MNTPIKPAIGKAALPGMHDTPPRTEAAANIAHAAGAQYVLGNIPAETVAPRLVPSHFAAQMSDGVRSPAKIEAPQSRLGAAPGYQGEVGQAILQVSQQDLFADDCKNLPELVTDISPNIMAGLIGKYDPDLAKRLFAEAWLGISDEEYHRAYVLLGEFNLLVDAGLNHEIPSFIDRFAAICAGDLLPSLSPDTWMDYANILMIMGHRLDDPVLKKSCFDLAFSEYQKILTPPYSANEIFGMYQEFGSSGLLVLSPYLTEEQRTDAFKKIAHIIFSGDSWFEKGAGNAENTVGRKMGWLLVCLLTGFTYPQTQDYSFLQMYNRGKNTLANLFSIAGSENVERATAFVKQLIALDYGESVASDKSLLLTEWESLLTEFGSRSVEQMEQVMENAEMNPQFDVLVRKLYVLLRLPQINLEALSKIKEEKEGKEAEAWLSYSHNSLIGFINRSCATIDVDLYPDDVMKLAHALVSLDPVLQTEISELVAKVRQALA